MISNGLAIPSDLTKQRTEFASGGATSGIGGSPQADIDPQVADYYHGTSTTQLLSILENVLLGSGPVLGVILQSLSFVWGTMDRFL